MNLAGNDISEKDNCIADKTTNTNTNVISVKRAHHEDNCIDKLWQRPVVLAWPEIIFLSKGGPGRLTLWWWLSGRWWWLGKPSWNFFSSFGHCPNYLPPPSPQFGQLVPLFLDVKNDILAFIIEPSNDDYNNGVSGNCDQNFGTFDDFDVKNYQKVSHNMI